MFFLFSWIRGIFEWTPLDSNPVDCFLRGQFTIFLSIHPQFLKNFEVSDSAVFLNTCLFSGLVSACGVSVLYNLLRVYHFIQTCR